MIHEGRPPRACFLGEALFRCLVGLRCLVAHVDMCPSRFREGAAAGSVPQPRGVAICDSREVLAFFSSHAAAAPPLSKFQLHTTINKVKKRRRLSGLQPVAAATG